MKKVILFVVGIPYTILGIVMVLYPPIYYRDIDPRVNERFIFIANAGRVDFYFFMYEVISYLLVGFAVYFIYKKLFENEGK